VKDCIRIKQMCQLNSSRSCKLRTCEERNWKLLHKLDSPARMASQISSFFGFPIWCQGSKHCFDIKCQRHFWYMAMDQFWTFSRITIPFFQLLKQPVIWTRYLPRLKHRKTSSQLWESWNALPCLVITSLYKFLDKILNCKQRARTLLSIQK
jgi:hypothetical protein